MEITINLVGRINLKEWINKWVVITGDKEINKRMHNKNINRI